MNEEQHLGKYKFPKIEGEGFSLSTWISDTDENTALLS